MTKEFIERWIMRLSAVATLLAFVDTYLLKSKVATALQLPQSVPTGLFFAVLFAVLSITMFFINRLAQKAAELAKLHSEYERLSTERDQLSIELEQVRGLAEITSNQKRVETERVSKIASFRKQAIAVLASHSRNETELQHALGFDRTNSESCVILREVIGDLVSDGLIQRRVYSSDYELCNDGRT